MTVSKHVLLVGWAGADWAMIHPLLDAGELPNLERLVNEGCIGRMSTLQPSVAPLVWNSIATGVLPKRHGMAGHLKPDGDSVTPTSGADRQVAPFWDVCSAAGLKTHVINWPTYPAEPVSGVFITDLFARFGEQADSLYRSLQRSAMPANLVDDLATLRIDPHQFGHEELLPFVPHAAAVDQSRDPGLAILASRLADAVSAHAMATAVLENNDWQVAAVCYDLLDRLGHSFMRFHPPRTSISRRSFELYHRVMNQAYRFCDQMLGWLLRLLGNDGHLLLFSDHGFRSGRDRPPAQSSSGRGDANWHRMLGILALHGPAFHKDRWIWGGNLLDICPTLYRLAGLSVGGLDGCPLKDAFRSPRPAVKTDADPPRPTTEIEALDPSESLVLQRNLIDEGYLDDQHFLSDLKLVMAEDACDFNLAQCDLQFGDIREALSRLLRCHKRRPDVPRFAIGIARCHLALGEHQAARRFVNLALEHDVPEWYGDLLIGQLLEAEGDDQGALERLLSSQSQRPHHRGLNARIGAVYERLGRHDEARRAFEKELEQNEDDSQALVGLGKLALADCDFELAVDYLLASAAIQEINPETHYCLAQSLFKLGRLEDALRAVERTLRQHPNHHDANELRQAILAGH